MELFSSPTTPCNPKPPQMPPTSTLSDEDVIFDAFLFTNETQSDSKGDQPPSSKTAFKEKPKLQLIQTKTRQLNKFTGSTCIAEHTMASIGLTGPDSDSTKTEPMKHRIKSLIQSGLKGYLCKKKHTGRFKRPSSRLETKAGKKKLVKKQRLNNDCSLLARRPKNQPPSSCRPKQCLHKQSEISNVDQFEDTKEVPRVNKNNNENLTQNRKIFYPKFMKELEIVKEPEEDIENEDFRERHTEEDDFTLPSCLPNLSALRRQKRCSLV
ncbi:unnamed protein product [Moneuplotes crassus]|uniref:Uncharacterized protein n=1 Tax=Euplotes crassus TaxID=5936 RepID=A0AAD1X787_EUPCR|nr:unnamed protein product [Moneuplotes crassus]